MVISAWLMLLFSSEVHRSSNEGIRSHGQPPVRAPRPRPEPRPVCFQADRVQSQGRPCWNGPWAAEGLLISGTLFLVWKGAKELSVWPGSKVDALCYFSKGLFWAGKRRKYQILGRWEVIALRYSNFECQRGIMLSRQIPVPFMCLWKDLMIPRSLDGHLILVRLLNKPSLLTSIENLREVYEGCEEWLPLFPTFLLQLSEGEHHINGWPVGRLGKHIAILGILSAKTWRLSSATQARSFLMTVRRGMPRLLLLSLLSPLLLFSVTMFASLMSCGTSPSLQQRQDFVQPTRWCFFCSTSVLRQGFCLFQVPC